MSIRLGSFIETAVAPMSIELEVNTPSRKAPGSAMKTFTVTTKSHDVSVQRQASPVFVPMMTLPNHSAIAAA